MKELSIELSLNVFFFTIFHLSDFCQGEYRGKEVKAVFLDRYFNESPYKIILKIITALILIALISSGEFIHSTFEF